jgi:hypothetical protein
VGRVRFLLDKALTQLQGLPDGMERFGGPLVSQLGKEMERICQLMLKRGLRWIPLSKVPEDLSRPLAQPQGLVRLAGLDLGAREVEKDLAKEVLVVGHVWVFVRQCLQDGDNPETRHPAFLGDVRKLVKIPKSMGFPVDAVQLEN